MVDMKAKPFYLSDEDCKWVEDTIAGMSLDEKIGQLFFNMIIILVGYGTIRARRTRSTSRTGSCRRTAKFR